MIKGNELRIGNFVNLYVPNGKDQAITGYNPITQISSEYIWLGDGFRCKQEDVNPIPLTEEILLKCGAIIHGIEYIIKASALPIKIRFHSKISYCEMGNVYLGDQIKHLHQLQNLYFALTGKELEVSL